jgi:hypothetical protein
MAALSCEPTGSAAVNHQLELALVSHGCSHACCHQTTPLAGPCLPWGASAARPPQRASFAGVVACVAQQGHRLPFRPIAMPPLLGFRRSMTARTRAAPCAKSCAVKTASQPLALRPPAQHPARERRSCFTGLPRSLLGRPGELVHRPGHLLEQLRYRLGAVTVEAVLASGLPSGT